MASVSGAWEAHFVAAHMWTLSFTVMGGDKTLLMLHWHSQCETGVKDIQICIHAAAGPERATQTLF